MFCIFLVCIPHSLLSCNIYFAFLILCYPEDPTLHVGRTIERVGVEHSGRGAGLWNLNALSCILPIGITSSGCHVTKNGMKPFCLCGGRVGVETDGDFRTNCPNKIKRQISNDKNGVFLSLFHSVWMLRIGKTKISSICIHSLLQIQDLNYKSQG